MAYIYKITNDINGKMYIGKTEFPDPYERWKEHLNDYKKARCKKRPLYEAINKYGETHFHFEVIEETDAPEEREQYWINKLHTYIGFKDCKGYNATLGGDGKSYLNLNEEAIIKYHTEEANYLTGITANYFNVSAKTIKKILKKYNIPWIVLNDSGKMINFKETGVVIQVNKDNKYIINVFTGTKEVEDILNMNNKVINEACSCRGSTPHYAYGYLWYYGKDLSKAIEKGEIKEMKVNID